MGLLKGRSRKGPETRGPGLIVGSFVFCMAFGHLQIGPLSPFLAPRDRSKMVQETQVVGWGEQESPDS